MTGAYFSASAVLARIDLLYPPAVEPADATQDAADDMPGGTPEDNAAIAESVFAGDSGPARDIVLLRWL